MKKIAAYLYFVFCRIFFSIFCPLKVHGRENLPARCFILCSNHNSHMDTPVLMLATGIPFSQFGMIAAKDYFFDNSWRKMTAGIAMNLIPIDRKVSRQSLKKNISACKNFVENNEGYLIMFPEGTRSLTGDMQPFKRGAAMIALALAVPLIPAYIDGTYLSMRKGQIFPRFRKIHVRIGKPIFASHNRSRLTELLENSIKDLSSG